MRRILSISPYSKGFAFIALEGDDFLRDWSLIQAKDRNEFVSKINNLKQSFASETILILDRTQSWIDDLDGQVFRFTRRDSQNAFRNHSSKYAIAQFLVDDFPELWPRLPEKRKIWENEKENIHIFDALSLAYLI